MTFPLTFRFEYCLTKYHWPETLISKTKKSDENSIRVLPLTHVLSVFVSATKTFLSMQKLAPTFNLTTIACKFGTVLLCVIELLTRSHLKFCFLINVFKIASCGNWLLAVSWHAVQYLRQRVIIYCKDQHSSQCSNWKLY